jgi:hypothetical protein
LKDADLLASLVGVGVTGYELVYLCGEKLFYHSLGSLKDDGSWSDMIQSNHNHGRSIYWTTNIYCITGLQRGSEFGI